MSYYYNKLKTLQFLEVYSMQDKTIGASIRKYRREKSLTIEKLAEKVGVTPKFLGDIERGKKFPSIKTLIKIANSLDVSIDCLLSKEVIRNKPIVINEIAKNLQNFNLYQLELFVKFVEDINDLNYIFKDE